MKHWTEFDPHEKPRTNITSKVNYRLWMWLKHTQGKKSMSQHIREVLTKVMNRTERDDEGMKFICKRCGRMFPLIPKSHGVTFMRFAGRKPKPSEMCDGEVIPISEEAER